MLTFEDIPKFGTKIRWRFSFATKSDGSKDEKWHEGIVKWRDKRKGLIHISGADNAYRCQVYLEYLEFELAEALMKGGI